MSCHRPFPLFAPVDCSVDYVDRSAYNVTRHVQNLPHTNLDLNTTMPYDLRRSAAGTPGASIGGYVRTKPRQPMLSNFARARSGSKSPAVSPVSDRSASSQAASTSSSGMSNHHSSPEAPMSPSASISSSASDWWMPL